MIGQLRQLYIVLKNERFFKIIGITCLIVLYGALAIFLPTAITIPNGQVGYGDIVPSSTVGKVFALMIVLSGPALLSLITASIASIFIERKIKEGKDCILLEIERDDFLRLTERRPQLGVKVLLKLSELLVSRLRPSGQDIVRLTTALSIALSK